MDKTLHDMIVTSIVVTYTVSGNHILENTPVLYGGLTEIVIRKVLNIVVKTTKTYN